MRFLYMRRFKERDPAYNESQLYSNIAIAQEVNKRIT
jgi:hypothetical protein